MMCKAHLEAQGKAWYISRPSMDMICQVGNGHHLLPRSGFIGTINVDLQG